MTDATAAQLKAAADAIRRGDDLKVLPRGTRVEIDADLTEWHGMQGSIIGVDGDVCWVVFDHAEIQPFQRGELKIIDTHQFGNQLRVIRAQLEAKVEGARAALTAVAKPSEGDYIRAQAAVRRAESVLNRFNYFYPQEG